MLTKLSLINIIKRLIVGVIVTQSLVLAFFMRPIQDDYFNLQSVQQLGVLGYLNEVWFNHGGNMVQFLIHCIVLLPTTQSFTYWNLALFFTITQLFCFWAIRLIMFWLLQNKNGNFHFWIPLLSLAGFEGLFVPGFLGTFGFSLATLAHLWPVMAFVVGLFGLKKFNGSWLIALILGLVAGNSNLGESAFALGAIFLLLISFSKVKDFELKSGIRRDANFYALSIGVFIGTIGIAAAPGFWNRASDQVGLPESVTDFLFRFAKSFASFSADALTHPMVWVIFLLGATFSKSIASDFNAFSLFRSNLIFIGSALIWLALIMGSTFAYPSWHQSMGMYILLFPSGFMLGALSRNRLLSRHAKGLLIFMSFVMLFTFLRIGTLGVKRAETWDRNLPLNICSLKSNPEAVLYGAEIRYPPFDLGVEDINTWKWMRDKYAGWVGNIPNQTKCP
jgi:hypothetical protein